MVLSHEHVHTRVEQRVERHVGVIEGLLHDALVERVQVQYAHFAAERSYVVDDLGGGGFPKDEVEEVPLASLDNVHEGLHAEGVVLSGHRQARLGLFLVGVARFQHVRLLDDLACVAEQLGAVVGQRHAAVAAREDGDAELLLKLLDGGG